MIKKGGDREGVGDTYVVAEILLLLEPTTPTPMWVTLSRLHNLELACTTQHSTGTHTQVHTYMNTEFKVDSISTLGDSHGLKTSV